MLPCSLPPTVAASWQTVVASEGLLRKAVDVKDLDFKVYLLTANENNRTRRISSSSGPKSSTTGGIIPAMNKRLTRIAGTARFSKISPVLLTKTAPPAPTAQDPSDAVRTLPPQHIVVDDPGWTPPPDRPGPSGLSDARAPSPSSEAIEVGILGAAPRSRHSTSSFTARPSNADAPPMQTVDGHVFAYLHSPPDLLIRPFFADVDGQHFILSGANRAHRRGGAAPPNPNPNPKAAQGAQQQNSLQCVVDVFEPIVLDREGDNSMYVLLYRKLRNDIGVVAELVHHLVFDRGGEGGVVAMYFEAFDTTKLGPEAVAKVEERRELVKKNFEVVPAMEVGCFVLVSRSFWFLV